MPQPPLQQSFVYGEVENSELLRAIGAINGRVLDVGSGVGAWAPRLREAGAREIVALDPSKAAIAVARERYDIALADTIEDAALDDLGGERFDVIIVADVLEHLVDPWHALRKLRGWATPDAALAVSVPNLRYYRLVGNLVFRGEFEYDRCGVRDWTHLRWFTRVSLERALKASGWEPRRWVTATTTTSRLLGRMSKQLAHDWLRGQLMVIARASNP